MRQMHFHSRVTIAGYTRCFCATQWHDMWPWPLTFWLCVCLMYSASRVRPTYQFLLSYDYRILGHQYWIFDHISVIWNSNCAFAVSRDLKPGQKWSTFLKSLTLDWTVFLRPDTALTWGCTNTVYTTLNRHRSPIKVVGHVILRMHSKLCSLHNGKTLFFAYNMA